MPAMRKNILITGASSGLGEGMARRFAAMGRNLALCARRVDQLEKLRDELLGRHPGVQIVVRPLDVNDHAAVFKTFRAFQEDLGSLDRIIVNAGLGKGQPLGTGRFDANLQTANTNFVAALAQCEAAMEIFREQKAGHLVAVSSVSAVRGMPRNVTTYAATKAGLATLMAGLRVELLKSRSKIRVSTIFPGYIATEINAKLGKLPFLVDLETGSKAMVAAIEKEVAEAYVPRWPWAPLSMVMRRLPAKLFARMV
jgi:short-subunit dehydrogenase